ncbi:myelin expression factor 2 isoform X2 [Anas acuta]|uniref:myelin expression factor 2 isoform X2 n=1 Tax=Anas platyrhynchos TaxID=8839 RepID=UPI000F7CBF0C|nr:myelin expression factor 2 isoform X3 [Anas platyrhynchos]|eukprot:XP_027322691.1 myelin expression factor 2 isoform X3 [Anas platyrhynchos]
MAESDRAEAAAAAPLRGAEEAAAASQPPPQQQQQQQQQQPLPPPPPQKQPQQPPRAEEAAATAAESGGGSANGVKMENDETAKEEKAPVKEKFAAKPKAIPSLGNKNRFHPYAKEKNAGSGEKKAVNRNRVFISNIPYDMKWQAIKDLMREKVGEVTYVELFKDAEGKSRGCGVVEFKDEEFVKKALETMNKYDLNGRPLNIKEDPEGEHARRALQRVGGQFPGGQGPDMAPGLMNLPPSIVNNPNIPPEVISNLQAGRLGSTIFVANLDFKVGWKKLKEVFSIAGTVKRADIKEDKDGKSRGMGTVTFEQAIEAVQAISMFNGQFLFDRPMHVKMDDKSVPHEDFRVADSKGPQLPRGLGGIGMGLGPGGQPISATQLNMGGGMGNMGPGGMGIDGPGFGGMNRMGGGLPGFRGMEGMANMGGFGVSRMGEMFRGGMGGNMDRDFGRSEMQLNRGFGDSFGRMGGGMGGMNNMAGGMGIGMDRMSSGFDRLGPAMGGGPDRNMDIDRGFVPGPMGSGMRERLGSKGNQIFVRNLPFDLTWQKLKEKFSQCGHVMFAEIKMENGKSKGCGTVRFDSPESAEKACRIMNGIKISGREIDVRLDRNA